MSYSGGEVGALGVALQFDPQTGAAPIAPTTALVAVAGLVTDGAHVWAVRFNTALGHSLLSPASVSRTTVTADHGQVALTAIPLGPAGTISREIVRSKAGVPGTLYTLHTIADNTTTTYTDNIADGTLGSAVVDANTAGGAPGVWVPPQQWLLAESDTLDSQPAHIARDVYGGSRDSDQGHRTGKYTTGGTENQGLFPDNGYPLVRAAIGKDVFVPAIAEDVTAALATANGVLSGTLTTGSSDYQIGQPILVDDDASGIQEVRQLFTYDVLTKDFTCAAPFKTHTIGAKISTPKALKVQPYAATDAGALLLQLLSFYQSIGGLYGQRYTDCMVGKLNLKGAAAKFELTADIVSNADRVLANGLDGNPSPTAFDFSDPTLQNLGFELTDGFGAFSVDPENSGTAALQLVTDMEDWELEINNNMKAVPLFDGQDTIRNFPMKREVTLKFSLLNQASRPVAWTDFVTKNRDMQFFAQTSFNNGTATSPDWQIFCIYIPRLRFTKAVAIHGLTDVIGESIEATALRDTSHEKLYLYYVNAASKAA